MSLRKLIPWQVRILSKLFLSLFPSDYRFWQRFGLFRHGGMDYPAYAYGVFRHHYDQVNFGSKSNGFVMLELGPGDSLFSAQIAYSMGAGTSYLVDTGSFAVEDMRPYKRMEKFLLDRGFNAINVSGLASVQDLIEKCSAHYLTEGLKSMQQIPDNSVDFIWSHAVLEHVGLREFDEMLREMRRVIKPDGECSHRVDLMDHLGGALNNLRFRESVWESTWMAGAGFYTNRIRFYEMLQKFEAARFKVVVRNTQNWAELPTPREFMAPKFAALSQEELCVSSFDVTLKPESL